MIPQIIPFDVFKKLWLSKTLNTTYPVFNQGDLYTLDNNRIYLFLGYTIGSIKEEPKLYFFCFKNKIIFADDDFNTFILYKRLTNKESNNDDKGIKQTINL